MLVYNKEPTGINAKVDTRQTQANLVHIHPNLLLLSIKPTIDNFIQETDVAPRQVRVLKYLYLLIALYLHANIIPSYFSTATI